ncbi:MAG: A/G-specific adenine glycosylase [Bdellovibrio sp.]|nr:A/G-specific adenine glycosylase [Bdellovibrio sp.]
MAANNQSEIPSKIIAKDQSDLIAWYLANRRELPWRKDKNPYRIWISEVMLQQTTVTAVIPFYEKFMSRFPSLESLASAQENEVLEYWAGLGYYSRARNLHKSAIRLAVSGFHQTAAELLELPGFGPYTSRAVSSLAFGEHVGVLDGNVIRVLSRRYGLKLNWWNSKEKDILQKISDALAQTLQNSEVNQGMMEMGATVCTPKKPLCLMCPWKNRCIALKENLIEQLPAPKPRAEFEIWQCNFQPHIKKGQIYLTPFEGPFLKNTLFPESQVEKLKKKPKTYDFKHGVTKYDLFISISKPATKTPKGGQWVNLSEIKKSNPTSLMTKILKFAENSATIKE